jgi:hypothetical protein
MMNKRFDEVKKSNQSDHELLKDVLVHVRKRVERVEQKSPRRR